jgi:hypothetical protein
MTRKKFKEILETVYKGKSARSQIMNMGIRPKWDKLVEFNDLGVPPEAFFNINEWLDKEEEKANKAS